MDKRFVLIACALLATAGTAAADDAPKDSMAMRQKMLDDCVAKQDPAADKHAATKACLDMLDKQMADKQMADKQMADKQMADKQMADKHMPDPNMSDRRMPDAAKPHDEAGKEAAAR